MKAWNNGGGNFRDNLLNNAEITKHLSREEIDGIFQADNYLKNVDRVFERLKI